MKTLLFDLETNGLPRRGLSAIHCLVMREPHSEKALAFNDQGADKYPIVQGLHLLEQAETVVGHNITMFDIPVIRQLYWPDFETKRVIDTLLLSRLFFPDIKSIDFGKKWKGMPMRLYGSHSLKAWGYRLGDRKDEFGETADWANWSQELEDYCIQDVHVTASLLAFFHKRGFLDKYDKAVRLEHDLAQWMGRQEFHGIAFNETEALKLQGQLTQELDDFSEKLKATFPYVPGAVFRPARNNKTKGYFKGSPFTKLLDFNPTSRDHVAWAFQQWRGWEPEEFSEKTNKPKITEAVLEQIGTDEALTFRDVLDRQKLLGQISQGQKSWLKVVHEGRIHHSCFLNTNTGRNAHSNPNLAQVSSDPRCRTLFEASPGKVIVGADMSGLEMRVLAHYLSLYDGGEFIHDLLNGDVHQKNADAMGVSRSASKTILYATLYGAGHAKIGKTFDMTLKGRKAVSKGKELQEALLKGITGLKPLLSALEAKGDVLRGLDGRPIKLQGKSHAALNYLCQGAGAVICKQWVVDSYDTLTKKKLPFDPLLFVHDELELETLPKHTTAIEKVITKTAEDVGIKLGVKCPLAAEAKHGRTWQDVH